MPGNRIVLFIAGALALLGTASAFAVGEPEASTALSSGGHSTTTLDLLSELPDLEVPAATTTTTTVAPTTTVPPTTTTTFGFDGVVPHPATTTTTTTPVDNNHALLYVENDAPYAVLINVNDVTENHWYLEPGAKAGPWLLETSNEHGDGAGVTRGDNQCGMGDGEDYFAGGHTYRLEAVDSTDSCGDGITGPHLMIYDLTTGTSDRI